jgi:hypothetical protein
MTSYYRLDAVVSGCPNDTTKTGKLQSSWMNDEKFCSQKTGCDSLTCMKQAGATCIAFNGDYPVCPQAFPTRISPWYQSVTDNRVCNCQCAGGGGSCDITGTQAQLGDQMNCSGGNQVAVTQSNNCATATPNSNPAMGMLWQARPVCQSSGTAGTNLQTEVANGKITLTGPVTTCCFP